MGIDQDLAGARARTTGGLSPVALYLAYLDWLAHLAQMPERQAELAAKAWHGAAAIGADALTPPGPASTEPSGAANRDPRFRASGWERWPFNALAQGFLSTQDWWEDATSDMPGASKHHLEMVSFGVRQLLDSLSPSNVPWLNPEVQDATIEQRGENLVRGAGLLADDAIRTLSGSDPVGTDAFVPGEAVARTPGRVVLRNRLIELIQYAPSTETVHAEPVLIVPAWIMKYYILDLSPHNSLVKYLVDQGHTVFMISWHNPTAEDRELGMEDYRQLGVSDCARRSVSAIVPAQRVHAVGYCLGGTLLAIAAAAMARDGDERLRSVTLFAAQTDFTEPGELALFIDESQVAELENLMSAEGYLDGVQMARTFQMLRSNDLIWSTSVREYLLGERQLPNDLMAWNATARGCPRGCTPSTCDGLFLAQRPVRGALSRRWAAGRAARHPRCRSSSSSTVRDHVAPWRSVYKLHLVADTELTFVLDERRAQRRHRQRARPSAPQLPARDPPAARPLRRSRSAGSARPPRRTGRGGRRGRRG